MIVSPLRCLDDSPPSTISMWYASVIHQIIMLLERAAFAISQNDRHHQRGRAAGEL